MSHMKYKIKILKTDDSFIPYIEYKGKVYIVSMLGNENDYNNLDGNIAMEISPYHVILIEK